MIDWPEKEEFLRTYKLLGATELARAYRTHREAARNHYHYLMRGNPNGRVVQRERSFPYLKYLRLTLKGIRQETHAMGLNLSEKRFMTWLGTKEGQWLLRQFSASREGGTQNDYEFGEEM